MGVALVFLFPFSMLTKGEGETNIILKWTHQLINWMFSGVIIWLLNVHFIFLANFFYYFYSI